MKIGGDKGGGTFKMVLQIVNVNHPNSPNNTCVFAIFDGPDSVANLTVLADRFQEQVNSLQSKEWKYVAHKYSSIVDCTVDCSDLN